MAAALTAALAEVLAEGAAAGALADENLRDGLLAQHEEACALRDALLSRAAAIRKVLGLPGSPPPVDPPPPDPPPLDPQGAPRPAGCHWAEWEQEDAGAAEYMWAEQGAELRVRVVAPGPVSVDATEDDVVHIAAAGDKVLHVPGPGYAVWAGWAQRSRTLRVRFAPGADAAARGLRAARSAAAQIAGGGVALVDGFLRGAEADALRAAALSMRRSGRLEPGEIARGRDAAVRSDAYCFADDLVRPTAHSAALRRTAARLDALVLAAAPAGGGARLVRGSPMVAVYPAGGAYSRHFDGTGDSGRRVTAIVYLNPFWRRGGELRVHTRAGARTLAPLHGRLIIFPCDSQNAHEVLPCRDPDRCAVTFWYYDEGALAGARPTPDAPRAAPERPPNEAASPASSV